jgi:hypothetical protein
VGRPLLPPLRCSHSQTATSRQHPPWRGAGA